jgi:hypothetical protein
MDLFNHGKLDEIHLHISLMKNKYDPSNSFRQWEFVIIGTLCSLWAFSLLVLVPDAPHSSRFFTYEERVILSSRKRGDHVTGSDSRKFKPDQVIEALMDPKTYLFFLFAFSK